MADQIKIGVKVDASSVKAGFKEIGAAVKETTGNIVTGFGNAANSVADFYTNTINGVNKALRPIKRLESTVKDVLGLFVGRPIAGAIVDIGKISAAVLVFKGLQQVLRAAKVGMTALWAAWNGLVVKLSADAPRIQRALLTMLQPFRTGLAFIGSFLRSSGIATSQMTRQWLRFHTTVNRAIDGVNRVISVNTNRLERTRDRLRALTGDSQAFNRVTDDAANGLRNQHRRLRENNQEYRLLSNAMSTTLSFSNGMIQRFQTIVTWSTRLSGTIATNANRILELANRFPGGAAGALAFATALIAVGRSAIKAANEMAKLGDEIDKASQRVGLTAEEFQKWDRVFKLSGTSMEQMSNGMARFTKNVGDAARGIGIARGTIEALGLQLRDTNGNLRPSNELFKESVIQLSRMQDITARNARAFELFGRAGKSIVPVLNQGAEGVERLLESSEDYVAFTDSQVNASAQYIDALTDLKLTFRGLKNDALEPTLTLMTQIIQMFNNSVALDTFNSGLGETASGLGVIINIAGVLVKSFMMGIDTIMLGLKFAVLGLMGLFTGLINIIPGVSQAFKDGMMDALRDLTEEIDTDIQKLGENAEVVFEFSLDETSVRNTADDIAEINEQAQQIAAANAKRMLESTVAGRIQLLQDAAQREISIIEQSGLTIAAKEQAIADIRANTARRIADIRIAEEQRVSEAERLFLAARSANLQRSINGRISLIEEERDRQLAVIDASNMSEIEMQKARVSIIANAEHQITGIRNDAAQKRLTAEQAFTNLSNQIWLDSLDEGVMKQQAILDLAHWERLAEIQRTGEAAGLAQADINAMQEAEAERHQERMAEIEHQGQMARLSSTMDFLQQGWQAATTIMDELAKGRQQEAAREVTDMKKRHKAELKIAERNGQDTTSLKEQQEEELSKLQTKAAKEERRKEIGRMWVAAFVNGAIGFGKAVAQLGFPAGPIVGGVMQGVLLTQAAIATANAKKQGLRNGGVVGGFTGATDGPDNTTINARNGEMFLNARQQRNMFNAINSGNLGTGGKDININQGDIIIQGNVTDENLDAIREVSDDRRFQLREDLESLFAAGELSFA